MTNWQTVEDAIVTSQNAEGSAMRENEKYLNSIDGKTQALTRSTQQYWNELINSDVIKFFLDLGRGIMDVVNLSPKIATLVASVTAFSAVTKSNPLTLFQGFKDQISLYSNAKNSLNSIQGLGITDETVRTEAYAAAVKNLTYEKQALLLTSQGLNNEQIRDVLIQNNASEADRERALSQEFVAKAQAKQAAQEKVLFLSKEQLIAAGVEESVANKLESASLAGLTRSKLQALVASKQLTQQEADEIIATLALDSANQKSALSFKGLGTAMSVAFKSNPVGFILSIATTILTLIPIVKSFITTNDELIEQADEIKNTYNEAYSEIKNNIQTISGVEDEFNKLSKGVNDLGENVSLSADDYKRYQEIVQQLVGISPSLVAGYDAEGNALANKNGLIEKSIKLMEQEQQLKAQQATSDNNAKKIEKGIQAEIDEYNNKHPLPYGNSKYEFMQTFNKAVEGYTGQGKFDFDIYKALVPNYDSTDSAYKSAWGGGAQNFAKDYYEQIVQDLRSGNSVLNQFFSQEQIQELQKFANQYDKNLSGYNKDIKAINRKYNDELATILQGEDAFWNLDNDMRNYAQNYVLNLDVNTDNIESKKTEVIDFVNWMQNVQPELRLKLNEGKQALLTTDEKGNALNVKDYKDKLERFKNELLSDTSYTSDQQNFILSSLGFDNVEKELDDHIDKIKNRIKTSAEDMVKSAKGAKNPIDDFINSLSTDDVEILYEISAASGSMTIDELKAQLNETKHTKGYNITPVYTYADVEANIDKYNTALNDTNEIMGRGTTVTQDYKDELIALGISEEDLNKCFYEANNMMVKDEKTLKNLVASTKDNISNNLKLSKSQSGLKYYDLVKEMGDAISETQQLDSATKQSIDAMLQEADSVRQSIYQYTLLEDKLEGVSNAFIKFNKAKEIDALNTNPDTFLEAVNLMEKTITTTGEFGTESFWAAVDMTVPPEVYSNLTNDTDRIKAIIQYFNSDVKKLLTIEDGDIKLDFDSMERFFNTMKDKGLITEGGSLNDWTFKTEQDLNTLSKAMGMTTDQTKAMLNEMDKYNINREAMPLSLQLDNSIEGRILKTTSQLDELQRKKMELLSSDGGYDKNKEKIEEINKEIDKVTESTHELAETARTNIADNLMVDTAISKFEELKSTAGDVEVSIEEIKNLGLDQFEINFDVNQDGVITTQEVIDRLMEKKLGLETPTKLQAQFAIDEIDSQIAVIQSKIDGMNAGELTAGIDGDPTQLQAEIDALKAEKVNIATQFDIELPDSEVNAITNEMQGIESFTINNKTFSITAATTGAWQEIWRIRDYQFPRKTQYVDVVKTGDTKLFGTANVSGTAHINGTAYAGGSWGAPKTETALVGEVGTELRVNSRTGQWETLGENGAEFANINRGDIIFDANQTRQLLKNGHINSRGRAYASGTAYSNGLYRPSGSSSSSSSSKKPSSSSNSSNKNNNSSSKNSSSNNSSNNSAKEAANDFKEVFDWFEVKLEEINELLELWGAQLENIVDIAGKGAKIDSIIDENKYKLDILAQGFKLYENYTNQLINDIPAQYREAAKNGKIAIETFAGDAGEKTLEAIKNYREWAAKVTDVKQQMEELVQTIAELAKQKFDVIDDGFDNKVSLLEHQINRIKDSISLVENKGNIASGNYYNAMASITRDRINKLNEEHKLLQQSLDESVKAGDIQKYSDLWYDMVSAIYDVDKEIAECTSDLEDFQNAINDIYWDNFDELISRLDYITNETDSLIGLLEDANELINYPKNDDYWGAKDVTWSKEGITSLGLYAQKMEVAEYQTQQYGKAIEDLNKDYKAGKYSENEYLKKLDELKKSQYDSIKSYYDAQTAIVELNKTRVDAIKNGIEKEISAYEKLISKQKESLSNEKDAFDFQKTINSKQKSISDIERKISALSGDFSASAVAERKKLQAQLVEAQTDLDETLYDRSIENQQNALDKELEDFKETKDKEIEGWEKYLEDVSKVVADSLNDVKNNTVDIYDTLQDKASEYGLTLSDTITIPWKNGSDAISGYQETFNTTSSLTYKMLEGTKKQWQDIIDLMVQAAEIDMKNLNTDNQAHISAQKQTAPVANKPASAQTNTQPSLGNGSTVKVKSTATHFSSKSGGVKMASFVPGSTYTVYQIDGEQVLIGRDGVYTGWVNKNDLDGFSGNSSTSSGAPTAGSTVKVKSTATHFGSKSGSVTMASWVPNSTFTAYQVSGDQVLIGRDGAYTGWVNKKDLEGYAKGTLGVPYNQLALIDELGEELVLHAGNNGKLQFLSKGSSVIPADITENLMKLGSTNLQEILNRNRASTKIDPAITNNNVSIDISYGDIVHIDSFNGNNIDELKKMVAQQFEQHTKNLNNSLKRYVR